MLSEIILKDQHNPPLFIISENEMHLLNDRLKTPLFIGELPLGTDFSYPEIIKKAIISELLGIHRNSVANKVNGKSRFSVDEAFSVRNRFFPDLETDYLFATEEV